MVAQGKKRAKTKTWFDYRLHLIADTVYELPMRFEIMPATVSEQKVLPRMIREIFGQDTDLKDRCKEFSADRELDSGPLKQMLWDMNILSAPLVNTRALWSEEKQVPDYYPQQQIRRLLDPEKTDKILFSEKGNVFCRCPAAVGGFECRGWEACHQQAGSKAGDYGHILRIHQDKVDRRIFTDCT